MAVNEFSMYLIKYFTEFIEIRQCNCYYYYYYYYYYHHHHHL